MQPDATPTRRYRINRVAVCVYRTGPFVRRFYRAASLCGVASSRAAERRRDRTSRRRRDRPIGSPAAPRRADWSVWIAERCRRCTYRRVHSRDRSRLTWWLLRHTHVAWFIFYICSTFCFYSWKSLFVSLETEKCR